MSKRFFCLIVTIALAATAMTFFVSERDTHRGCFVNDVAISEKVLQGEAVPQSDGPAVYPLQRGLPLKYYRQAFPANCTFNDGGSAPSSSQINAGRLVFDWLTWFVFAMFLSLGIKKMQAKS